MTKKAKKTMIAESKSAALRKNSRNAAIGTAFGAVIVFAAMIFSFNRLQRLEQQAKKLNSEIKTKQKSIDEKHSDLKVLEDRVRQKQRELERVKSWGTLFRICSLGGQIAISRDQDEAQQAYAEIEAMRDAIDELAVGQGGDAVENTSQLIETINELGTLIQQRSVPEDKWTTGGIRDYVIDLGERANATMKTAPEAIQQFNDELKRVLYDQAIGTVRNLYQSEATQWDEEPTTSNRDIFWRLYWGDLVFIESDAFKNAMIGIRDSFEFAQGKKPEDLKSGLQQLAKAYHEDLKTWPRLPADLLLEVAGN